MVATSTQRARDVGLPGAEDALVARRANYVCQDPFLSPATVGTCNYRRYQYLVPAAACQDIERTFNFRSCCGSSVTGGAAGEKQKRPRRSVVGAGFRVAALRRSRPHLASFVAVHRLLLLLTPSASSFADARAVEEVWDAPPIRRARLGLEEGVRGASEMARSVANATRFWVANVTSRRHWAYPYCLPTAGFAFPSAPPQVLLQRG